jgi:hypothetical protein
VPVKADKYNMTDAAVEARVLQLAALDWSGTPHQRIRAAMDVDRNTLYKYRASKEYAEAIQHLRDDWKETLDRMPKTTELRREISYGMGLGVRRVIGILADDKSSNKDVLGAARLVAQMDGRFLGSSDTGESVPRGTEQSESVASELLEALKRTQRAVN